MKNKLFLYAVIMTTLTLPQASYAYDLSAVSPSGHTLYYNLSGESLTITYPYYYSYYGEYWYGYSKPTGCLVIPDSVAYNGHTYAVTKVGAHAFEYCYDLTSVTLPNTITSIETYAFDGCSGIYLMYIPDSVELIGYYAFSGINTIIYHGIAVGSPWGALHVSGYEEDGIYYMDSTKTTAVGCSGTLVGLNLPSSVTTIIQGAFRDHTNLETISLGNSMQAIGNDAFYGCTGIREITIPNSTESIGNGSFGNSGLSTVTLGNRLKSIGDRAFLNCPLTSVTIPDSVTFIGTEAFLGTRLTSVTLGQNLRFIEPRAFMGLPIPTIWMHNNVEAIGEQAFARCTEMSSAHLGSEVLTIGNYAFDSCIRMRSLELPTKVATIGDYAFRNCREIRSVNISDSTRIIGTYAFSGCTNMTTLTIGKNVDTVRYFAFGGCPNLTTINYKAKECRYLQGLYSGAITTVNFGNEVEVIPSRAFEGFSSILSIKIPDAVETIGSYAFSGCVKLSSATIGNEVRRIGEGAFKNCYRLTTVNLGKKVNYIEYAAFSNCGIIGELIIPQEVISMGAECFYHCYGISKISCLGRVAPIIENDTGGYYHDIYPTFSGVDSNLTVNVPCGSSNLYRGRWPQFHKFNEREFYFNALSEDVNRGTVSVVTEPSCSNPQAVVKATAKPNWSFDHWSDGNTNNPYTYTVTGDVSLVAYFVSTIGIEDIENDGITIRTENGNVIIEGDAVEHLTVNLYTIEGRTIYSGRHTGAPYHVPSAGIYILKIGNHQVRKIVVL